MGAGLPLGPRRRRSFVILRGRRDRVRSMRPMASVLQLSHSVSALAACRCMSQPRAGCRPLRVAKLAAFAPAPSPKGGRAARRVARTSHVRARRDRCGRPPAGEVGTLGPSGRVRPCEVVLQPGVLHDRGPGRKDCCLSRDAAPNGRQARRRRRLRMACCGGSNRRPCGRRLPSTTRACPRPAGQAPGLDPRPLSSRSGVCGSSASTCGSTSGTREPGTASSSPTLTLPILGFIQMLSCQARYLSGSQ